MNNHQSSPFDILNLLWTACIWGEWPPSIKHQPSPWVIIGRRQGNLWLLIQRLQPWLRCMMCRGPRVAEKFLGITIWNDECQCGSLRTRCCWLATTGKLMLIMVGLQWYSVVQNTQSESNPINRFCEKYSTDVVHFEYYPKRWHPDRLTFVLPYLRGESCHFFGGTPPANQPRVYWYTKLYKYQQTQVYYDGFRVIYGQTWSNGRKKHICVAPGSSSEF